MIDRIELVVVQHGESGPAPGDPGLTDLGRAQAEATARHLAPTHWDALYTSPLARARETAVVLGRVCGVELLVDGRLRERMHWQAGPRAQTREAFLEDWQRSTADRSWRPPSGESSFAVGARVLEAISDFVAMARGPNLLVVSHGGATVDLLRSLFGDETVRHLAPAVIDCGVPSCALTRLSFDGAWRAEEIAATSHLG